MYLVLIDDTESFILIGCFASKRKALKVSKKYQNSIISKQ